MLGIKASICNLTMKKPPIKNFSDCIELLSEEKDHNIPIIMDMK
ncbi:hypothetical protein SAMN04488552_0786 [Christiangramia echinicola]|uniref:Uncharacterized protein n=1 Tax=Christiangramia echinicola TaxID=279359 RepID=A0A1H1LGI5_9FLAO|nr:hypothetical protein SAMN04488552_0786 [Christiangramia echinicola]